MEYKKDDYITTDIIDMGSSGEGIGKVENFTFFIKDAVIGDRVEAKVMKVKKNYAYARLMKLVTPSPVRTTPRCAYHRQCGGCQIQALDYGAQLKFKENKIKNNLTRIGGFSSELIDRIMEPVMGMENPYNYRNKAQFPIGTDKSGKPVAGFYAGRTHVIVPNTDCALGVAENKEILEIILGYMEEFKVSAYDEASGSGLLRHVLIRKGFATGELMVCLVINGDKLPKADILADRLAKVEGMTSICVSINKENTNVIMGKECRTIWGRDTISDVICGISFSISPLSFFQVNPVQTQKLYGIALEYAGLTGTETVWDLYCGIGTISLCMAKRAAKVYGIEIVGQAIADARENARRNGITNAEFFVGGAEEVLPRLYEAEKLRADVVCVDPPRKGCDEACLETIVKMVPERVVYVSCDSATLARDLRYLCERGYELKRVRGCDMFPQTGHVETVVQLYHQKSTEYFHVNYEPQNGDYLDKMPATATYREIKQ